MKANRLLAATLSALGLWIAGAAVAADPGTPAHGPATEMEHGTGGGMSCHDMMGMMGGGGMMGGMMGGGMKNHSQTIPSLPPGNEKLNTQMQAEMMQAMGTIMQKYADKVAPPKSK